MVLFFIAWHISSEKIYTILSKSASKAMKGIVVLFPVFILVFPRCKRPAYNAINGKEVMKKKLIILQLYLKNSFMILTIVRVLCTARSLLKSEEYEGSFES